MGFVGKAQKTPGQGTKLRGQGTTIRGQGTFRVLASPRMFVPLPTNFGAFAHEFSGTQIGGKAQKFVGKAPKCKAQKFVGEHPPPSIPTHPPL